MPCTKPRTKTWPRKLRVAVQARQKKARETSARHRELEAARKLEQSKPGGSTVWHRIRALCSRPQSVASGAKDVTRFTDLLAEAQRRNLPVAPLSAAEQGEGGGPAFQRIANLANANPAWPSPVTAAAAAASLWIQSGDSSDFDGYLVAAAVASIAHHTKGMRAALVVPERRACRDRAGPDINAHDPGFAEEVLDTAGRLLHRLCPDAMIVRGALNKRNVIPLKFVCHEPKKYAPALQQLPAAAGPVPWHTVQQLAAAVASDNVQAVVLDVFGACGFLDQLVPACPQLGPKIRASGIPVSIMAGILAEEAPRTMPMPGRDPRATMNALYYAPAALLELAEQHNLPLLFTTNNVCNQLLTFEDDSALVQGLGLNGLLACIARCWFGPHLKGKYVPFDWVALAAMLLVNRFPAAVCTEQRELWVARDDASVLVLLRPDLPRDDDVTQRNLQGCQPWGMVQSVTHIDASLLRRLAVELCAPLTV